MSKGYARELLGLGNGVVGQGPLSDLDIVIFSERAEPRASLCCWGTLYQCDIMFVRPADVEKKLEGLFLALLEGLWFRK